MSNLNFITTISLMFVSSLVFGQSATQVEKTEITFKILNSEIVNNLNDYVTALEKADFTSHRLKNKNNIIKFDSGLEVEIFSAQTLLLTNSLANPIDFYLEEFINPTRPTFKLVENVYIIELHEVQDKFHPTK